MSGDEISNKYFLERGDGKEIIQKLEDQVGDILEMYDMSEKLCNYEQDVHGGRELNEHKRRQKMVAFVDNNGMSPNIFSGCQLFGLAALYIWSRKGAKNILDISRMRQCLWTSGSIFMAGSTFGCCYLMEKEKIRMKEAEQNLLMTTRIAQNEQTHALLRTMKFHLNTRHMPIGEVNVQGM